MPAAAACAADTHPLRGRRGHGSRPYQHVDIESAVTLTRATLNASCVGVDNAIGQTLLDRIAGQRRRDALATAADYTQRGCAVEQYVARMVAVIATDETARDHVAAQAASPPLLLTAALRHTIAPGAVRRGDGSELGTWLDDQAIGW